ncbi:E3 ubiquitin-protein ligase bre1 [Rhizopus stolonifer]|uniref:E3 ubiquitin protein ligase n=1 Tax=Rhizopus stolonifer TaxID=4846 RepID=A0A367J1K4_RHIST|nr:E3 ubiquitin-protein ligase bre1 [Rhizopus stolonifer]
MAKLLVAVDTPPPPAIPVRKMTLDQQKEWNDTNQMAIKQLCTKVWTRLQTWTQQLELMEHNFRAQDDTMLQQVIVSDWLKDEIKELGVAYKRGQHVMMDLQKHLNSLLDQTDVVKGNVQMVKTELDASVERLEHGLHELHAVWKRHDRAKSKVVAALRFGGLGDMAHEPTLTEANQVAPKEEETQAVQDQPPEHPLEEQKLILSLREKEFDTLKRERQILLREEERLLNLFTMGEDRLAETEYVKTLKLNIEHYRDRCFHLDQRRVEMERETDKITSARQQLVEQVKSEKVAQGIAMEAEMRRLENDLTRIRGQRDHFQLLVDEQKSKETREKEMQDKIVSFANQGKMRVAALLSRIEKLKAEQEVAGPFAKEANTFNQLKENLSHMRVLLSSLEMIEKKESCGDVSTNREDFMRWKTHPLIETFDALWMESQQSSLMIEFLEKNESHLLEEIDRVASIYNKLEEQQQKKLYDIAHKREQASKLQAEKLKYAQTFHQLMNDKEKLIMTVTKLRSTKDARQEVIKQLEEKEKTLERQSEKEEKICKLKRTIEEDKTDLEDINHLCEDYRISIEHNELMLNELQKMLKEKTKAFEDEKQLQTQAEETYEKLKKKWDKIAQGDNPAEQQLIDECEELRALLKCSTCRQRFRTHILTRCMHTFCKHCIDARLETRQRRCPTCSEPFGANDVKNFYL